MISSKKEGMEFGKDSGSSLDMLNLKSQKCYPSARENANLKTKSNEMQNLM